MTYALLIVSKDHPRNPWPQELHTALYERESDEEVTKLNEGAWLVHLDSSLLYFARLVCLVHDQKFPYRVTFFDHKPSFVGP